MKRKRRRQQKPASTRPRRRARPSPLLQDSGEHVIPKPLADRVLTDFLVIRPEHEERQIREYVEIQARPTKVTHLEKIKTEHLRTRVMDVWDVRTTDDRYWVITNPTNLYSQRDFPSIDFTLSFHIGLMERVFARQAASGPGAREGRFAAAWRRWEQAVSALDHANEAEDFQAVGMRCRECLLDLVAATEEPAMVPEGEETPQRANFIEWTELIANAVAHGGSAERVRQYLKGIAEHTWQLVSWLTHAKNATWADGQLAVDATQNVLSAFGAAVIRHERGAPERCPRCSSYRLTIDYRSDLDTEVMLCEACGWTDNSTSQEGDSQ